MTYFFSLIFFGMRTSGLTVKLLQRYFMCNRNLLVRESFWAASPLLKKFAVENSSLLGSPLKVIEREVLLDFPTRREISGVDRTHTGMVLAALNGVNLRRR